MKTASEVVPARRLRRQASQKSEQQTSTLQTHSEDSRFASRIHGAMEPPRQTEIPDKSGSWRMAWVASRQQPPQFEIGPYVEPRTDRAWLTTTPRIAAAPTDPYHETLATVGQVLKHYREGRLSYLRKGHVMGLALEGALASIRHRRITSITRRELAIVVDGIADRAPIHANRSLAYMKAFFNWTVGRGYIEHNPAAAISKPSRERTRERTPSLAELLEIWEAAGELGYPFGPTVRLLLLTAARRDEIGAMRLVELDLPPDAKEGCWNLPAGRSKNGRAIRVPLAPLARSVLESALLLRFAESPFVFTTVGDHPISGWSRAKTRLDRIIARNRRATGQIPESMTPWRFHDLRRSFATHACDILRIDPAVTDRCLNHVGASTTSVVSRVYARNEMFDQRREALTQWSEWISRSLQQRRSFGANQV